MRKEIWQRFVATIVSIFLASIMIFAIIRLAPGDPINRLISAPGEHAVSQSVKDEHIKRLKEEAGLDQTPIKQYLTWMKNVLKLDLGESILTKEPVNRAIKERLPASLALGVVCTFVQLIVAVWIAVRSILYYEKAFDNISQIFLVLLTSVPFFVLAIFFLQIFAVKLKWYPMNNDLSLGRLALAGSVAGISTVPSLARFIRILVLDELGKPYIIDGLAKGYDKKHLVKRALRNVRVPIFQSVMLSFVTCIGGLVVTEDLFMWPGLGQYGLNAVTKQDYTQLQGYLLVVVVLVLITNGLTDLISEFMSRSRGSSNEK